MKTQTFFVSLIFFLAACAPVVMPASTEMPVSSVAPPTDIPTSTIIPPTITPSPLPTQPVIPLITPDAIQVERWREYEDALAKGIFPLSPFAPIFCEWDILGRSGQKVYVWADCGSSKGDDARPAVIYLEMDGSVRSVEIPKRGSHSDIDRIFLEEVQMKFGFYAGNSVFGGRRIEMYNHLIYREAHPEEPPLIVLLAMPTATPSPMPTQLFVPIITPDANQIARWKEYQTELAKLVLSDSGAEFPFYKDALCEWDILGHSNQDVYVWAVCATSDSLGEKPAVIYLDADGSIQDVKVVFHGSSWESRIQELFPADVQEKIYLYSSSSPFSGRPLDMRIHLGYRLKHPEELPLIVLSAMPTATHSPMPTQLSIPIITPDANQIARWKEYEVALAKSLNFPSDKTLCEWDILGTSEQVLYVWVVCESIDPFGTTSTGLKMYSSSSTPALIRFEKEGTVQSVEIPAPGISDYQKMFPAYVQEKFESYRFGKAKELSKHIEWRRSHPEEPPLIILLATPIP